MWQVAVVLAAWGAVAYKCSRVLVAPTAANRTLLAMLALPTLAATAAAPPVYRWLGESTGVPNLGVLVATTAGLLGLVPCLNVLLHRDEPLEGARRRARRRYGWFGALAVLQAVLWSRTAPAPITPLFGYTQAADPVAVAYLMVHQASLAAVGAVCFVECRRMARRSAGPLRAGLWTVAVSGLAAVGVVVWNAAYYTAVQLGLLQPQSDGVVTLSVWAVYASVLGLALGVTVPDWGPRLARRWIAYQQLRALEPAWRTLVTAVPEVELDHAYPRWDVERRLHRRVVEMHDAELALRPGIDALPITDPLIRFALRVAEAMRAAGADLYRPGASLDGEVRVLLGAVQRVAAPAPAGRLEAVDHQGH